MTVLSPKQIWFLCLAILLLRLVVGAHFFGEGVSKLESGTFTAKHFLADAKGPWAGFFRSFLDDPDGIIQLCLKTEVPLLATEEELRNPEISPAFTLMLWRDYADQSRSLFENELPTLEAAAEERIKQAQRKIETVSHDPEARAALEASIQADQQLLRQLREQPARIERIYEDHKNMLEDFLEVNRAELIAYFGSRDRLEGFSRDGDQRHQAAEQVISLQEQVDTIRQDRRRKFQSWIAEVGAMWNSLETQLNELVVERSPTARFIALHRPFDQPYSWQKMIDRIIPWFDTVVGILLIIGLLTRIAASAAAGFLASIVMTQPPWIAGTAPTILYIVELAACLVLVGAAAGRIGGLDYIIYRLKQIRRHSATNATVANEPSAGIPLH